MGEKISLICIQHKGRGRKIPPRIVRGKVVYLGDAYLTVQHHPAGWRECFLYADILTGDVKINTVESLKSKVESWDKTVEILKWER